MTDSLLEVQTLYRLVLNLKKRNDQDFGFSEVSREQKFIEKFGSEKQFLENLGVLLKDNQEAIN